MAHLYSTDQTQPNTKVDPENGPEVRFGSASSPLFKNLSPLRVRSESARGPPPEFRLVFGKELLF